MRLAGLVGLVAAVALFVAPSALAIRFSDGSLLPPSGVVGQPYFHKLDGQAGCNESDYNIRLIGGTSAPPGLQLAGSSTDWRIEGVPAAAGDFDIWLELKGDCPNFPNDNTTAERMITIKISPALTIDQTSVPTGTVGAAYAFRFTASGGGTQRWTFVGGTLPPGVSFGGDGSLSGTPSAKGDYAFSVKVDDGSRSSTRQLAVAVREVLAITPVTVPQAEVGRPFVLRPAATGGSERYTWSVPPETPLPAGLTLDPATGAIGGSPTAAGRFPLKVTVTDSESRVLSVDVQVVVAQKLSLLTRLLRAAKVGRPYTLAFKTSGGVGELSWKLVSFRPAGIISWDRTTGTITWSPRKARPVTVIVRVSDELKAVATQTYRLTVQPTKKAKRAKRM